MKEGKKKRKNIIIIIIIIIIICFLLNVFHSNVSYYYNYFIIRLEFFTSVLADGFSLEFEWQQVSSSFQDSSQEFGRS